MKDSKKIFNGVIKKLLTSALSTIGPKNILGEGNEIYIFKDDLKYDFHKYYRFADAFTTIALSQQKKYASLINDAYGYALFRSLVENISKRIHKRCNTIDMTLDKFLIDEDFSFAQKFIDSEIEQSKKKYKVLLLTDLIELPDRYPCTIGSINIFKIDNDFIKRLPKSLTGQNTLGLSSFLTSSPLPKDIEKYIALETSIFGCHYSEEKSLVFEKAIAEFRSLFAYLSVCDIFLDNVAKDSYKIEKKDIAISDLFMPSNKSGFQCYLIHPIDDLSSSKKINLYSEEIRFSDKKIILSKGTIEQLGKRCLLNEFNKINKEKSNVKAAEKISRSLDWFLKASVEDDRTDSVIAYFISLETLFSTGQLGANNRIIAENMAMTNSWETKRRLDDFKKFQKLLGWRNEIVHHGGHFEDKQNCWSDLRKLKIGLTWSLIDVLRNYCNISAISSDSNAINNFYQKQKFTPTITIKK